MEMGYLTVLHVRLGAKFGDLHAKNSHSFRNEQMPRLIAIRFIQSHPGRSPNMMSYR